VIAYVEIAPDWICEVLSLPTQKIDRIDKLSIYAEFGVGHCWYVDPDARTLEVFVLAGGKWLLAAAFKDADPVAAPPFEVHSFSLDVLWVPDSLTPDAGRST
jgi:Uma2 family endonuclease